MSSPEKETSGTSGGGRGRQREQQKETDCDSYFTTLTPKSSVTVPDVSTRPLESICIKPSGTESNPSQLNFPQRGLDLDQPKLRRQGSKRGLDEQFKRQYCLYIPFFSESCVKRMPIFAHTSLANKISLYKGYDQAGFEWFFEYQPFTAFNGYD